MPSRKLDLRLDLGVRLSLETSLCVSLAYRFAFKAMKPSEITSGGDIGEGVKCSKGLALGPSNIYKSVSKGGEHRGTEKI